MLKRPKIRSDLLKHFSSYNENSTVEECLNFIIKENNLNREYKLKDKEIKTTIKSREKRKQLKKLISQELAVMKKLGLIKRVKYGLYKL